MAAKIAGVTVGLVVSVLVVAMVEAIGHWIYPVAKLDTNQPDALYEFMRNLPLGAFLFVIAAHGLGSLLGGFSVILIVRKMWWTGPLVIGGMLMVGGIYNLVLLPHPRWFLVTDLLMFIPMSLLGGGIALWLTGNCCRGSDDDSSKQSSLPVSPGSPGP